MDAAPYWQGKRSRKLGIDKGLALWIAGARLKQSLASNPAADASALGSLAGPTSHLPR